MPNLTINLGGAWELQRAGSGQRFAATVPGCVHTDLLKAGAIEDPFYRDNELKVQWIGETDWIYSRSFSVGEEVLARDRVLLRCQGLDTLAVVTVNGSEVGEADNMYRLWEFDIKPLLRRGQNRISIRFNSVTRHIQRKEKERSLPGWFPRSGRSWVRKEPCNFGWDWGPVLVTAGIWRGISTEAFDVARIADLHIRQEHSRQGAVTLRVRADVERASRAAAATHIRVTVLFQDKAVAHAVAPVRGRTAEVALPIRNPKLWWPNGMGDQPLYCVVADLLDPEDHLIDNAVRRIGLRRLELQRQKDRWGESFRFAVNGVPFFAKGANWIPADAFATRVGLGDYETLLRSAAGAHMNMLRVWGGGVYESEDFYNLCDELGLCVWQDFMFACSTYPTFDRAFLRSVRAEAEHQVRRLRHHPCIALWCGNNELEQGLVADRWSEHPPRMSWRDYARLFDRLLPEVVRRNDPERAYWPCSPHNPCGDRNKSNNPACGDAHLWEVWHGRKPFESYRTNFHRFCSEFGFQSFPEPRTVRCFTVPADRNPTSYIMEQHQRSGIGNDAIFQYMLAWFRLPSDFENSLWLSQILQGVGMKYAVEHWRRNMPRSMGALYWQLNDCWPVASWSSIDYLKRWKALQYMAKRFYAPLLVSGVEDLKTGRVEAHATSDLLKASEGVLSWRITSVAGESLETGSCPVRMPARTSRRVRTLDLRRHLDARGPRDLLLWLDLSVRGRKVSADLVTFARPKHLELAEPEIKVAVSRAEAGAFRVRLTAARPALWTWLELSGADARFSDNFFHLQPGQPVEVIVEPSRTLPSGAFRKQLRVRSLKDTYQ
jgi:beta-mannosidase